MRRSVTTPIQAAEPTKEMTYALEQQCKEKQNLIQTRYQPVLQNHDSSTLNVHIKPIVAECFV